MTELPIDSLLPSGALENDPQPSSADMAAAAIVTPSSSSSVISPLSLPSDTLNYFDARQQTRPDLHSQYTGYLSPLPPSTSVPLPRRSASLRGPPRPRPPQFLSPRLAPTSTQIEHQLSLQRRQQRSVSLSPTRRTAAIANGIGGSRTTMALPSRTPSANPMMPLESVLETGVTGQFGQPGGRGSSVSSQTRPSITDLPGSAPSANMVQRLAEQNRSIRAAWEAERKYLEANRERAEEVYKEERALMEEDRMAWAIERDSLLDQVRSLQRQVSELERGSITRATRSWSDDRAVSPKSGAMSRDWHGGGGGSSRPSPESKSGVGNALRGQPSFQPSAATMMKAPPPHPGVAELPARLSLSRLMQAETSPFIPAISTTSQRAISSLSQTSMMAMPAAASEDPTGTSPSDAQIPSVDIQTIHPELEGIQIKATAIQPTFTGMPASSVGSRSPKESPRSSPPPNEAERPEPTKRGSKEHTLKILATEESRRLTLYAGHTPNHSLSVLPSTTNTDVVNTASSSGDSTPTLHPGSDGAEIAGDAAYDGSAVVEASRSSSEPMVEPVEAPPTMATSASTIQGMSEDDPSHEEPGADKEELAEDRALRGPLMVRNMPAHDEIFFRRLSDKLEEVSQDQDAAVPTVLRTACDDDTSLDGVNDWTAAPAPAPVPVTAPQVLAIGEKSGSRSGSISDEEMEIPLKLKKSSNFGAPLGQLGH